MKLFPAHLILAIALYSMPVYAESANFLTVSSLFTQMDVDKDGVIKPSEINKQSMLSNEFSSVDQNSDGVLDPKEFEIFIAKVNI